MGYGKSVREVIERENGLEILSTEWNFVLTRHERDA